VLRKSGGSREQKYREHMNTKIVCVVGLGYVGLPLAEAFSKHLKTIGFDIDEEKIRTLHNVNNENRIEFTTDPSKINQADFILICVPTPVTKSNLRSRI
jgi:UDPglucose 6-dehydrogenase/UDP-N-acetyl-D-galactosamine dehydrogenase